MHSEHFKALLCPEKDCQARMILLKLLETLLLKQLYDYSIGPRSGRKREAKKIFDVG
jgi:hypothetical protein